MTKLEDKLIASVNKKEQDKTAGNSAPAASTAAPAANSKPAKPARKKAAARTQKPRQQKAPARATSHATPAPSQGELHPKRIWPD